MADPRNSRYPSRYVRPREGESWKARHDRRIQTALDLLPQVIKWTIKVGVDLTIANDNQHWIWKTLDDKHRADWWPSSAKLVIDRKFEDSIHAHDPGQVARELRDAWQLKVKVHDE